MIRNLIFAFCLILPLPAAAEPHPLDMTSGLAPLLQALKDHPRRAILENANFPFSFVDINGAYHEISDQDHLHRILDRSWSGADTDRLENARPPFINEEGASIGDGLLQAAPICHDPDCTQWTWKVFVFQDLPLDSGSP